MLVGGPGEDRTPDPMVAKHVWQGNLVDFAARLATLNHRKSTFGTLKLYRFCTRKINSLNWCAHIAFIRGRSRICPSGTLRLWIRGLFSLAALTRRSVPRVVRGARFVALAARRGDICLQVVCRRVSAGVCVTRNIPRNLGPQEAQCRALSASGVGSPPVAWCSCNPVTHVMGTCPRRVPAILLFPLRARRSRANCVPRRCFIPAC